MLAESRRARIFFIRFRLLVSCQDLPCDIPSEAFSTTLPLSSHTIFLYMRSQTPLARLLACSHVECAHQSPCPVIYTSQHTLVCSAPSEKVLATQAHGIANDIRREKTKSAQSASFPRLNTSYSNSTSCNVVQTHLSALHVAGASTIRIDLLSRGTGPWARAACFTTVSLSTAESSCIELDKT